MFHYVSFVSFVSQFHTLVPLVFHIFFVSFFLNIFPGPLGEESGRRLGGLPGR